ncbi:MAG: hypothetical protein COV60_00305 [Candidatus Magasanikbacteria bacterium CG11_big_fil_rev_8_21_14_0_20_43_7]|uniref:Alginate export domain-containing protein n=1 Tax=Candidatus Magasanikbacteria bacterium CG11_big_fil_rev_8_21_14_0_20_43_7 TaxID=1974654 RepID=A0A2H0N3I8_9BACT|nr:MAG: hypothetical protein COV60_00305 [Candidatus Magasanikbacteria bacterium CG11_big_fil_rev_8_21_14_0_20_43_7]
MVEDTVDVRAHFIPGGNLMNGLSPYLYLGAAWKPAKWLDLELDLGVDFTNAEPLISLKPSIKVDDFWAWAELDVQFPSYSGYWFVQLQYKLHDVVHIGVEGEGWGNWAKPTSWSNGAGPNVLLRFAQYFGVDLALHLREGSADGGGRTWGFDPFVRVHLFF